MIDKLFLAVIFLGGALGNAVGPINARQENLNTYVLYTRAHNDARSSLDMPTARLLQSNPSILFPALNAELQTIVIVHGHGGDRYTTLNPLIKNSFFDENVRGNIDVNVIVVDWSSYAKQSYPDASLAVSSVGRDLGEYLKLLVNQKRIKLDKLHLIGFDLGAHAVGFAGRQLNGTAARITGLDPSGNGWGERSPRLSKFDARYVEVIHTDGGGFMAKGIGTAIGHVDFFVNGGSNQPGCLTHECNHNRAYELYAATLVRDFRLYGNLCRSQLQMSLNTCRGSAIHVGGDDLFKRHGTENVYRVNTGRVFPY